MGAQARAREAAKNRKYSEYARANREVPAFDFTAFAIETYGTINVPALNLLKRAADIGSKALDVPASKLFQYALKCINIRLRKSMAYCIVSHSYAQVTRDQPVNPCALTFHDIAASDEKIVERVARVLVQD